MRRGGKFLVGMAANDFLGPNKLLGRRKNLLRGGDDDPRGDACRDDGIEDRMAGQADEEVGAGALNVLRGKGVPGSFNVKGTFDANVVYNYLEVVAFNGSSWVATRDRPGEVPGSGWQLLSSAGRRGPRGERGPMGPRGADAPTWRSVSFDPKKMSFVVRLSDGSPRPLISLDCIFAEVGVDPRDYSIRLVTIDGFELKFSLRGLFEQFFDEVKGR
jgi:hypothetical protein